MKAFVRKLIKKNAIASLAWDKIAYIKAHILQWWRIIRPISLAKFIHPRTVFLVLTPDHTNLGDHAITMATMLLLRKLGIKYKEITVSWLYKLSSINKLDVFNGKVILINGGGNLGTLWPEIELLMQQIVSSNPLSPIRILPNSIYYEQNESGKNELKKSQKIYNAHSNLIFYAREKLSFDFMSAYYKQVRLVPDMVLSLDKTLPRRKRSGCLLCLRSDCEMTLTSVDKDNLTCQLHEVFGSNITNKDMNNGPSFSIDNRSEELECRFDLFRRAELVVTDRFHGMVFSAITSTPCIVINSKSPKMRGCYETWFKEIPYIRFCNDIKEIRGLCAELLQIKCSFDSSLLKGYFGCLATDVMELVKKRY